MKVVLDNIIFSLQKAGGISGAWAKIVKQLLTRTDLSLCFIERRDALDNLYRQALDIPAELILPQRTMPLALDRYLPVYVESEGPFIFHSSYYRHCVSAWATNVITLHDFIYEQSHSHSLPARWIHALQKGKAIREAQGIVAVSDETLRSLKALYDIRGDGVLLQMTGNPVVCEPVCNSRLQCHRKDYVLYVGDRAPYKNFSLAACAAVMAGHPFVVAGAELTRSEVRFLAQIKVDYKAVVYPSENLLSELYSEAFCLIYPSKFEGFGIPIIEAQAHRCPVIIGPCEVCRQTSGGAALVSAEFTATAFAECVKELDKQGLYERLSALGVDNVTRFDTMRLAEDYVALYRALVDKFW